ncbi:MAG: type II toxin-antitoxin system HicB family antitoxin [Candidatus Solibacter usitatus]|nr:type II toxin-antitoxin system HicB family antitoxin [Candidatus Solibacter usitatus]
MLTAYIQAAMRHAHYEIIDDPRPMYGSIPECPGVWAAGATLEECREELQSVLEDWIVLGLRLGDPIPVIDGIAVAPEKLEPIDV